MQTLLSQEQRIRFLDAAFSRYGCYYTWPDLSNGYSGKDLDGAKYSRVYDCSGLVTTSLFDSTEGKVDRRAIWNAQRLMKNCMAVEQKDLKPGDLCFYGSSREHISHVMLYIGTSERRPSGISGKARVIGASGGDRRTLTPQIAEKMNAKVTTYNSPRYRKDLVCFGRLVTKDE